MCVCVTGRFADKVLAVYLSRTPVTYCGGGVRVVSPLTPTPLAKKKKKKK